MSLIGQRELIHVAEKVYFALRSRRRSLAVPGTSMYIQRQKWQSGVLLFLAHTHANGRVPHHQTDRYCDRNFNASDQDILRATKTFMF